MSFMKSPAFQFYPSDWLSSRAVRLMDAEQRGWYIQLLAEAWQSRPQATLPNDPEMLLRLAEANQSSADFTARWAFVLGQFKLKGDLLINARLAHEKKKQTNYSEQRKKAGIKGAEKRWHTNPETKEDITAKDDSSAIAKPSSRHAFANGKPMADDSFSSSSSIASSSSKKKEPAEASDGDPLAQVTDLIEFRGGSREGAGSFIGKCLKHFPREEVEKVAALAVVNNAQDPKAYMRSILENTARKYVTQAEMNSARTAAETGRPVI